MARQKKNGALSHLESHEGDAVLRELLKRHPELQQEAEEMAESTISDVSVEGIAQDVSDSVLGVDLDDLNDRAGKHSWGYVEPSEAAWELLEEAVEDIIEDMKRRKGAGSGAAAEKICRGMVLGLYKVRNTHNDGAMGWAPDFPAETAGQAVSDFIELFPPSQRSDIANRLLEELRPHVGEWMEMLERVVQRASA